MKRIIFSCLLIFITVCSNAQADTIRLKNNAGGLSRKTFTDRPPQAVYFGIGGSGPIFSVNYDRRFGKRLNGFGFTAGLGFFVDIGVGIFSIPVSLNYLFGKKNHFFELAAGVTYAIGSSNNFIVNGSTAPGVLIGHINLGYRYQHANGGFFARTGISPLFADSKYITSYYLGIGYCF